MKKHIVAFSIVGMFIMGIASSAYALLIEGDLFAIEDGLITMDTITGLEWLDLSETRGYSFNEVIGGFGEYTTTYGFRAATREEVAQLYTNAGIVNLNAEFVVENVPGVALLHDLMGCTQCGSYTQSAHGFIGEFTDDGNVRSAAIDFAFFPFNELRARADISIIFGPPNEHNKDIGTYLVRIFEIEVDIDIKPGSCPNPLNTKSHGVLPVAILGTADFDVTQIDVATIQLEGVSPLRSNLEDVATPFSPFTGKEGCSDCTDEGLDGFLDLTLKFDAQKVVAALGDITDGECLVLSLNGNLMEGAGGTAIVGEDVVVILQKGNIKGKDKGCDYPIGVLKTGQTVCYDGDGNVIDCAGTGQDGELQKGAARSYTDNGDGTITDNNTGLMWEKLTDDGSIHDKDRQGTWDQAFVKIAVLNTMPCFAGYCDWRLPNVNELQSLADYGRNSPAIDPVFNNGVDSFTLFSPSPNIAQLAPFYWSSTTSDFLPDFAWGVSYNFGTVIFNFSLDKPDGAFVRAVRGP